MKNNNYLTLFKNGWPGLLLACVLGIVGYLTNVATKSPLVDPLIVALSIGIALRLAIGDSEKLTPGFILAPLVFIPPGIIFYGAASLNFVEFTEIDISLTALLIIIMLVYFGTILLLGKLLQQKRKITYLTATGSAICGASAIAVTAPVVEAESEDVSISLISVFVAASFGLFVLLPFLAGLLGMTDQVYALLSAMTLQFTGFVKAATSHLPEDLGILAVSIKAARYLGLLIAIPLFASLIRKRLYLPWFLWAFLGAGIISSFVPTIIPLIPIFKPTQVILWSMAMAGIGLNADVKALISDNGIKALVMAFVGFFAAILVFFLGIAIIGI